MRLDLTAEYELLPGLQQFPRAPLFQSRTDIEVLHALGQRLGIELHVKRDDLLPLAMGGNKVRQLEYYFGQAVKAQADTVLITGAVQSNFVRLCAAAARKLGMQAHVQLEHRVPGDDPFYRSSGNVLLDKLLGAKIHYFDESGDEKAADVKLDVLAQELEAQGRRPYVIHLGTDHPAYGGIGYARAAVETFIQYRELNACPDHVVLGTGSGLTHAGFLAGARAIKWQVAVHGICVRRGADEQHPRVAKRTAEIEQMIDSNCRAATDDVIVDDSCLNPGYGQMNEQVREAMMLAAQDEGLLLDPVYTARVMAGLIERVRRRDILPGQTVTFIHTGGLPAIFAYENQLTVQV